jgi:hypothetical protein
MKVVVGLEGVMLLAVEPNLKVASKEAQEAFALMRKRLTVATRAAAQLGSPTSNESFFNPVSHSFLLLIFRRHCYFACSIPL